ncbi:hypothetical protein ROZALSC1DRAFT_29869 [Rozella allomycis CSF55]|uniref:Uncharacterized protein n=1 Tax=Rozella allomycis (strain CSF55) TaxID=988480 RepID=A0A075AW09_ROZAC|nr:hypothetical protein O9G_002071 [Rozella allomycis CSF55]RKP18457.1 hypothetical protein ROZALSC1DRAFT_29869 [Rozella allomycis CSF55]|eukprot:EPZ34498.1 hypothetical protein O9G_002071 [Rozella allomycis CSF55]
MLRSHIVNIFFVLVSLSKANTERPTDANGETCKFLDPPPTTDPGIWNDCHSAYTQSSSSFSITRNGIEQLKVVSQVSMNPHAVLCFNTKQDMPNGYTVNEGFKIKLKELREEFSVDRKALRGANIHVTENGPKCTDDAENDMKIIKRNPKEFCSTESNVKMIKFWILPGNKQYSFFNAKEIRKVAKCSTKFCIFWKCVWNEDNVQLIEFGSKVTEVAVYEVQRISPDGQVISSDDITQITGTINEALANHSDNDINDIKISLVHKSDFVNPLFKKLVVMKNGKLFEPIGSNTIDTVKVYEKFFLEVEGDMIVQESYSFQDYNMEYSKSDWSNLPLFEPSNDFEEFKVERTSFNTFNFRGINPDARLTTVLESEVQINTFYENYGEINDFSCEQKSNDIIECIITGIGSPGGVALYLYQPSSCSHIDKVEGFTLLGLKLRLHMRLLTHGESKTQFFVCTPLGICRTVAGVRKSVKYEVNSMVANAENVLLDEGDHELCSTTDYITELGAFVNSCFIAIRSPFETIETALKSFLLVFVSIIALIISIKTVIFIRSKSKASSNQRMLNNFAIPFYQEASSPISHKPKI